MEIHFPQLRGLSAAARKGLTERMEPTPLARRQVISQIPPTRECQQGTAPSAVQDESCPVSF